MTQPRDPIEDWLGTDVELLPPRLRSTFLLHHYAGFGVREVAAMLGRPEETVKADLHHARAKLKAALADTK